jgi:hypothetical protein
MKTHVSFARLWPAMLLAGFLAMTVHVLMLDVLHIPYPKPAADAPFWQYVSRGALHAFGLL